MVRRFHRALENVVDARIAFDGLTTATPPDSIDIWEATIQEAELERNDNPKAMDVMHSQIKSGQTLKEITTTIMREDGLSISNIPDNGDNTDWFLEGLDIEDEQLVFALLNPPHDHRSDRSSQNSHPTTC